MEHSCYSLCFILTSPLHRLSPCAPVRTSLRSRSAATSVFRRACRACAFSPSVTTVVWLVFQEGFKMGLTLEGTVFSLDPLDSRCWCQEDALCRILLTRLYEEVPKSTPQLRCHKMSHFSSWGLYAFAFRLVFSIFQGETQIHYRKELFL